MKLVPIQDGELSVGPLAFESFGVRSMATYVETNDVKSILDPGSALGPRFRLNPHEREYEALYKSREAILYAAEDVDLLTISHYHFDHFVPNFENWRYIWSSPEMAEELYTDRLILAKDISKNINTSQRKRGYMFRKKNLDHANEIRVADGREFEFGSTKLRFSEPLYHGPEGTKLGFVLILTVETPNCTLVHAPDVQGPMYKESLNYILSQSPDLLIVGGPPTYLSFKLDEEDLLNAERSLIKLAEKVPKLIVDHHLLRTTKYPEFLAPIKEVAEKSGHKILTASELIGKKPQLLEARRKEFHKKEPIEKEWYERVERGEFKEGF